MEKVKYKMQQRDWVYILILSMVGQFIIYFLAYVYNSSTNALGYVSFAGTMVSIILAVIAIGYTYGESIRQKHNEDELIIQIRGLSEIKEKLGDQVDVLEGIANLESSIGKKFEESYKLIKENTNQYLNNSSSEVNNSKTSNNEAFLSSTNYIFDIYTLILYEIISKTNPSDVKDFSDAMFSYLKNKADNENIAFTKFEAAMAIWSILKSMGLMDVFEFKFDVKKFYKKKYPEIESIMAAELKNLIKKL